MASANDEIEQFKKRPGTSGISGQLYETKLISLILYRLLHNDNVEDFHLASNMDEIGAFDDVCLRLKLKDYDRELLVLIQAKHKENDDTTLDDKNDLVKWCESIMRVRDKFNPNKKQDKIFSGKFNDIDCAFIVYTNAKYDFGKTISSRVYESSFASSLNSLVSTGAVGTQPIYTDKDVEEFGATILKEEIPILAEQFEKYLNDTQSMNIMNNEYMLRYHVILGQKVVNVSDIQEKRGLKCRTLIFREDFFENTDEHLILFRKHLCKQLLKNRAKIKNNKKLDLLVSSFLNDPCTNTLSPLIENHVIYKNNQLEFLSKRPQNDIQRLKEIDISPGTVEETKVMTATSILLSLKLSVPIAFGNIDLAIRGNQEKIEQRLNHLTTAIVQLFEKSEPNESLKYVTIDDTIDEGILSCNGGISGGVGNIFDYDNTTKLLKFTDDYTLLPNNAKSLYLKLKNVYNNLDEYRLDIQTSKFPKLSLDCSNMAREFLSKLIIYAKQGNHFEVEKILKNEMEHYMKTNKLTIKINPDALFIHYHEAIQKWWMLAKTGPYISRKNNYYHFTIRDIVQERQAHRARTSLTNLKWRRYRQILKKNSQSSSSDTEKSSPSVIEEVNNEEAKEECTESLKSATE